jgi:hypothetical protein
VAFEKLLVTRVYVKFDPIGMVVQLIQSPPVRPKSTDPSSSDGRRRFPAVTMMSEALSANA